MKSALAVIPQFTFLSAIRTVIGQPTSGFVAVTVARLLNSVKVHINKGCTLCLIRSTYTAGEEQALLHGVASGDVLRARDRPAEQVSASRALCWE